ncbi:MAG: carboxypeptidase-like regulatory domain-containing protein, partial [Flavisolibacter sp.]
MKKINMVFYLLLLLGVQSFAQQTKITGQVRSRDDSSSIAGATVAVKNGGVTKTDEKGRFEIKVHSLPVTLNITNVGYRQRN